MSYEPPKLTIPLLGRWRTLGGAVLEARVEARERGRVVADRIREPVVEAPGEWRTEIRLRPQRPRRQDRRGQRRRAAEDRLDLVVRRKEVTDPRRSERSAQADVRSRGRRAPRLRCRRTPCSRPERSRSSRRPSGSVPRSPNIDEFELTRYWFGFGQLSGHPAPPCLPLTTSMSRLRRPYRVTPAVCAPAGAASTRPAMTTAMSFALMEFLRLRIISEWRRLDAVFAVASESARRCRGPRSGICRRVVQ